MDAAHQGRRIALISMATSAVLGAVKIAVGLAANSAALVSDGIESASDVFASGLVLFGLSIAAKPADAEHPYGHGRYETLAGLAVGLLLCATGALICYRAFHSIGDPHVPAAYAIWPLILSTIIKSGLSILKLRAGRRLKSEALIADGWNDTVDILSGLVALAAVSLSIWLPGSFRPADLYGAMIVGLIVIFVGARVIRETTSQLTDTMPDAAHLEEIRRVALSVPGALDIEKCFARKTGLQYHVDLHLEVDPDLTVRESHFIAHEVKNRVLKELDWVADVLVHVEPYMAARIESGPPGWRIGN